jgi:hypothetical protein
MPLTSRKRNVLLVVVLCFAVTALCAVVIFGQSGRKTRKPAPSPVPELPATPTPTPTPDPGKADFLFIVGMDKFGDYSKIPLSTSAAVLRSCVNRLDEPVTVKADTVTSDMNRSDAIRRAKGLKEGHVVWLKFLYNNVSGRATSSDDPYNVYIQYEVLAPTTAKVETSGRIFPAAYRTTGGVIVQPRTTTVNDYYLIQAGRETGEAILEHFHIK